MSFVERKERTTHALDLPTAVRSPNPVLQPLCRSKTYESTLIFLHDGCLINRSWLEPSMAGEVLQRTRLSDQTRKIKQVDLPLGLLSL